MAINYTTHVALPHCDGCGSIIAGDTTVSPYKQSRGINVHKQGCINITIVYAQRLHMTYYLYSTSTILESDAVNVIAKELV